MGSRWLLKQLRYHLDVAAISHADGKLHAAQRFRKRPVDDFVRDEVRVGDDDFGALESLHRTGTDTDARDLASGAVDIENVTDVNGTLELQDESGDEVVDDVLQAKADAHTQCAGEHGELVQFHASQVYRKKEHQEQQQVVQRRGNQFRQTA